MIQEFGDRSSGGAELNRRGAGGGGNGDETRMGMIRRLPERRPKLTKILVRRRMRGRKRRGGLGGRPFGKLRGRLRGEGLGEDAEREV